MGGEAGARSREPSAAASVGTRRARTSLTGSPHPVTAAASPNGAPAVRTTVTTLSRIAGPGLTSTQRIAWPRPAVLPAGVIGTAGVGLAVITAASLGTLTFQKSSTPLTRPYQGAKGDTSHR